jgi:integrase
VKHGDNPYKRPGSPFWYCFFIDASGRERRASTKTRHKRAAEAFLAEKRKEAEEQRLGIASDYGESARRPLDELVTAYKRELLANDRSQQYVDEAAKRIRFVIGEAGIANLASVATTKGAVQTVLVGVREKRSAKTVANYMESLTTFGAWLHTNGHWPDNPFAYLRKKGRKRDADRKFKRRQLTWAEVQQLAAAALVRHQHAYAKSHGGRPSPKAEQNAWHGRERAVLYLLAATTGLRAGEVEALKWEDLHMVGDSPFLTLPGRFTKNGADAVIPLQTFVVEALRDLRRDRGQRLGKPQAEGDQVLHVPERIAEHVRRDAMHAGLIPSHRPADARLDLHSLRHSCVRILREAGVPVEVVQQVMRHSDVRLTLQVYGSVDKERVAAAMKGLLPAPTVGSLVGSSGATKGARDETTRNNGMDAERGASDGKRTG